MRALWPLYHAALPPVLSELAQTPPMKRLRQVGMNCGCEYTSLPRFLGCQPYSRFDHSVGVALIVWHFTGDVAQAAAGLFHDVATPVFAHVVDFLNGDHLQQESTEADTEAVIAGSRPLQAALSRHGLTTADVADYHRYPVADNDTPRLSADRLEYTLGNLLNYGFAAPEAIRDFYRDLTVLQNEDGIPELGFRTPETAEAFTLAALQCARVYIADEDRFAMQILADLLKLALDRGILRREDLNETEPAVIRRLEADSICRPLWRRFRELNRVYASKTRPVQGAWIQVPAKLRYIDPLALGQGRASRWSAEAAAALAAFQTADFTAWLGAADFHGT